MRRICDKDPYLAKEVFAQDSWAAQGCAFLNLKYNSTYFVESTHNISDPIEFHNWWTFINPFKLDEYFPTYNKYLTLEIM